MSPILINSTSNVSVPNTVKVKKYSKSEVESVMSSSEDGVKTEAEIENAREERKATGRSVAIIIFLSLMSLALYHVIERKTTILAGAIVPAMILFTYLFFVVQIRSREKKKRKQLESGNDIELSIQSDPTKVLLHKKISTASNPSISSISLPSTSGMSMNPTRNFAKHPMPKSASFAKMDSRANKFFIDPKTSKVMIDPKARKVPAPFKKAQSQSHIQVKSNQSAHISIEHETKKLKKSRSFDKNNYLGEPRHMIDNKKIKTKH